MATTSRVDDPARNRRAARRQAVERAEAYLREHTASRVSLADLCRVTGLSERCLRKAFYEVRGLSPSRYLRHERLRTARLALRRPTCGGRTTVTNVAVDCGFFELGRFAGAYRQAFGEVPSATLRAALLNRQTTSHDGGEHTCLP